MFGSVAKEEAWRRETGDELLSHAVDPLAQELTATCWAKTVVAKAFAASSQPWSSARRGWLRCCAALLSAWHTYTMGTYYPRGKLSQRLLEQLRRRARLPL